VKPSANATLPGPRTDVGGTGKPALAIRWIYPRFEGLLTILPKGRMVIGRAEDCDLVLEGGQVSRRHAEIRQEGLVFLIRDLGSSNHLYVDGQRVVDAALSPGGLVRVGEWLGAVVETEARPEDQQEAFHEVIPGYWAGPTLWPRLEGLRSAAVTKIPILIEGETGTGKEGIAQAIHAWSGRPGKLVAVNCAAIPENLAEGELFGYRKGAFTGADRTHEGTLRASDKGTLFLDEVADLPAVVQPKLLRALEQGEVTPIGQSTPTPIDLRVVAAIQRPLSEAVEGKTFRPDLHARLDGLTIRLPRLRERVEEIPFLFWHLLKAHWGARELPRLETPLVEALCRYEWPHNIRELDRLAQQLAALHGKEQTLAKSHLPEKIREQLKTTDTSPTAISPEVALTILGEEGGNVRRAADRLMLSRQQLYRLLETIPDFDLDTFRRGLQSRGSTEASS
jgi:transcriptional regulator with PAS, ATPase and Fis domain